MTRSNPDPTRQMHLGLFASPGGVHLSGWRHPDATIIANELSDFIPIARTAERGLFDFLFLADRLTFNFQSVSTPSTSVLDPIVMLAGLAGATDRLGLIATASTTYSDPFTLSRQLLSLDHLSGGRAGWNIVTTAHPEAAANFSRDSHPRHEERYHQAEEFVTVARGLWASLPESALRRDKTSGSYFDPGQVHTLNHRGEHYAVKGPLNLTPSAQGHPVLVQAGSSEPGRDFAARNAEVVFSAAYTAEEARDFRNDLHRRAAADRRAVGLPKVLPGLMPIIGRTEAEARAIQAELQALINTDGALKLLSTRLGHDLTGHDLDGPLPEIDVSRVQGNRSRAIMLVEKARAENLTLRQLHAFLAGAFGHLVIAGDPEQIADTLIDWFDAGAADGFIIMPAFFLDQFARFVDLVVPLLQTRGYFRSRYDATTLRGHLGLAQPYSD